MRKLLIVDPSLLSLEALVQLRLGDRAGAARRFDEVVVYADASFAMHHAHAGCRPCLIACASNLKRCTNAVFHLFGRRARSAQAFRPCT